MKGGGGKIIWTLQRHLAPWTDGSWTPGVLAAGTDVPCMPLQTLELPWRDNLPDLSRVPADTYKLALNEGEKGGLRLEDKHGRTNVCAHAGNWASDVRGCIAPGLGLQPDGTGVLSSVPAVRLLVNWWRLCAGMGSAVHLEILDPPGWKS